MAYEYAPRPNDHDTRPEKVAAPAVVGRLQVTPQNAAVHNPPSLPLLSFPSTPFSFSLFTHQQGQRIGVGWGATRLSAFPLFTSFSQNRRSTITAANTSVHRQSSVTDRSNFQVSVSLGYNLSYTITLPVYSTAVQGFALHVAQLSAPLSTHTAPRTQGTVVKINQIFHKVVQRHSCSVVGSLVFALLHVSHRMGP